MSGAAHDLLIGLPLTVSTMGSVHTQLEMRCNGMTRYSIQALEAQGTPENAECSLSQAETHSLIISEHSLSAGSVAQHLNSFV